MVRRHSIHPLCFIKFRSLTEQSRELGDLILGLQIAFLIHIHVSHAYRHCEEAVGGEFIEVKYTSRLSVPKTSL